MRNETLCESVLPHIVSSIQKARFFVAEEGTVGAEGIDNGTQAIEGIYVIRNTVFRQVKPDMIGGDEEKVMMVLLESLSEN